MTDLILWTDASRITYQTKKKDYFKLKTEIEKHLVPIDK